MNALPVHPLRGSGISALLTLGIASLVTFAAGPALASCALAPPLGSAVEEASHVFVGTVTAVENGRRWVSVRVEEVWKGEDLPEEVEVRAGPKDPPGPMGAATSVDRTFQLSERYLFVPYDRNGSIFRDNACTNTSLFRASYERFAPEPSASPQVTEPDDESAHSPLAEEAPEDEEDRRFAPIVLVGGALVVLVGGGLFLYRRRVSD